MFVVPVKAYLGRLWHTAPDEQYGCDAHYAKIVVIRVVVGVCLENILKILKFMSFLLRATCDVTLHDKDLKWQVHLLIFYFNQAEFPSL